MAGIHPDQIPDLVKATQANLIKKGAFVNLRSDLSDYVGVRELKKNHQHQFDGGLDWEFDAQIDDNHSARFVDLYEDDAAAIADSLIKGKVGPRYSDANYVFDIHEKALNGGASRVVDFVYSKYCGMIESHWKLIEAAVWGKPESSADKRTPYGLAYWIVRNSSEGFNGGNPAGFSDCGDIDASSVSRWKNYTGAYSAVSKDDLLKKMRRAAHKTQFRSPVNHAEPTVGGMKNGIYTNLEVLQDLEGILEAQNMNLGNDIASKDGRTLFKGRPVVYAPYLDDDSQNPVYMIDWSTLAFGIIKGWQERVSSPKPVANKHNVYAVFLDAAMNIVCTNRRKQTVFYKAG